MERFLWICASRSRRHRRAISHRGLGRSALRQFFPYGTLIVNLVGCFGIAAVMHAALTLSWSPTVRSAVATGFIGGLTTYSSFNYETSRLLEEGAHGSAAVNAIATIIGSFAAGWLGLVFAKQLLGR